MTILWALLLLVVLAISTFVPGFAVARRLRLGVDETLCASIGLSTLFLHLIATCIYFLPVPWAVGWTVTGGIAVGAWKLRSELRAFLSMRHIKDAIVAYGCVLGVGLLIVTVVRHYSGGVWSGDWLEHYERTRFFVDRWPYERLLIGLYTLPARPPLMNLLAGYFLGHFTGAGFGLFQIVFTFLNLLIVFPCVLLAGHLVPFGSRRVWAIAGVLAVSPFVMQNATFTWTKLLSAFFVIQSLAFYLRGWRKKDTARMLLSAAMMAGGVLVHYSAGPYAIVLVGHYLLIARHRPRPRVEMAGAVLVGGLILFTWLGWSVAIYGFDGTVASNTSVSDARKMTVVENVAKIGQNTFYTFIPRPLRTMPDEFRAEFGQPNPLGSLRDFFFTIYLGNAPMAIGLIGWMVALGLAIRHGRRAPPTMGRFWLFFMLASAIISIAVHGGLESYGLASVVLVPWVLIGLTILAAGLTKLPLMLRGGVVLFIAIDALLGVILQHRMQMHDFQLLPADAATMSQAVPFTPALLSVTAVWNSVLKHRMGIVFLGDELSAGGMILFVGLVVVVGMWLMRVGRISGIGRVGRYVILVGYALGSLAMLRGAPGQISPIDLASAEQAVAAEPESAPARYRVGRAWYDARQLQPAAANLIDACLLDPYSVEARYLLRMMLLTHGAFVEDTEAWAAELYRRNPTDPQAIRRLAEILEQRGHRSAAARRRAEVR